MNIRDFQLLMQNLYFGNDEQRGIYRTGLWLMEELGELAHEIKVPEPSMNKSAIAEEMADIYAWVASLANLLHIDLEDAVGKKYPGKCPKCSANPCICKKGISA